MTTEELEKLISGARAEIQGHLDRITPENFQEQFAAISAEAWWAAGGFENDDDQQ